MALLLTTSFPADPAFLTQVMIGAGKPVAVQVKLAVAPPLVDTKGVRIVASVGS